jgi:hypothetical protein
VKIPVAKQMANLLMKLRSIRFSPFLGAEVRTYIIDRQFKQNLYRWSSLGYHVQTNNQDNFFSTDFGLKQFNPPSADKCLKSKKERFKRYRRYVYEAGSLNRPEKGSVKIIEDRILEKERSKDFKLRRSDRFRYRTGYFTDSGIIDSISQIPDHAEPKNIKREYTKRSWENFRAFLLPCFCDKNIFEKCSAIIFEPLAQT